MRTPPPSPSRMRAHALRVLSGKEIDDWDLHWLCEENQFYKQQLNALLMEPFKQHDYEVATAAKAARVAAIQHRKTLSNTCKSYRSTRVAWAKRHSNQHYLQLLLRQKYEIEYNKACIIATCRRYRSTRVTRAKLHSNRRYLRLLRLQKNDLEKQGKWDKFVMDVMMFRISQAHSWIDHRHSKWMSDVIFSSNPFELVDAWPEGSKCSIDPQMSLDWVPLQPPLPPTVIQVENSLRKRLLTYERALEDAYFKIQDITKPKPSITTTDEHGQRTTTRSDSAHTAAPELTLEHWMAEQLRNEAPGTEEQGETGV